MNPSELSKKKYVWRYYIGSDGMLHKDRCPVIYSNVELIYYKIPGATGGYLSIHRTKNVIENEVKLRTTLEDRLINKNYGQYVMSWIETDITQYQRNIGEIKRQAEIRKWNDVVAYRRKYLQDAIDHLEELKKKDRKE